MIKDIYVSVVENVTGRVIMQFTNATSALIKANTPDNCTVILEKAPEHLCYWDFENSRFVVVEDPAYSELTFDFELKQWVDLRSFEQLKEIHWTKLKQQRTQLEFGGFEFEGGIYDSDQVSQGRIMGAALAGVDQVWTLKDNSTRLLTAGQLKQLYAAMAQHVAQSHERGRIARAAIEAAQSKEDVEAVTL